MTVVDRARGGARWSRKFPGHVDAFSQVHRQMAQEINQALFPGRELVAGNGNAPRDEAYFSYLRGRYALNQRTPAALHRAVHELEAATKADPQFSESYTALATAHALLAFLGYVERSAPERAIVGRVFGSRD
jgi:hypothetical protein